MSKTRIKGKAKKQQSVALVTQTTSMATSLEIKMPLAEAKSNEKDFINIDDSLETLIESYKCKDWGYCKDFQETTLNMYIAKLISSNQYYEVIIEQLQIWIEKLNPLVTTYPLLQNTLFEFYKLKIWSQIFSPSSEAAAIENEFELAKKIKLTEEHDTHLLGLNSINNMIKEVKLFNASPKSRLNIDLKEMSYLLCKFLFKVDLLIYKLNFSLKNNTVMTKEMEIEVWTLIQEYNVIQRKCIGLLELNGKNDFLFKSIIESLLKAFPHRLALMAAMKEMKNVKLSISKESLGKMFEDALLKLSRLHERSSVDKLRRTVTIASCQIAKLYETKPQALMTPFDAKWIEYYYNEADKSFPLSATTKLKLSYSTLNSLVKDKGKIDDKYIAEVNGIFKKILSKQLTIKFYDPILNVNLQDEFAIALFDIQDSVINFISYINKDLLQEFVNLIEKIIIENQNILDIDFSTNMDLLNNIKLKMTVVAPPREEHEITATEQVLILNEGVKEKNSPSEIKDILSISSELGKLESYGINSDDLIHYDFTNLFKIINEVGLKAFERNSFDHHLDLNDRILSCVNDAIKSLIRIAKALYKNNKFEHALQLSNQIISSIAYLLNNEIEHEILSNLTLEPFIDIITLNAKSKIIIEKPKIDNDQILSSYHSLLTQRSKSFNEAMIKLKRDLSIEDPQLNEIRRQYQYKIKMAKQKDEQLQNRQKYRETIEKQDVELKKIIVQDNEAVELILKRSKLTDDDYDQCVILLTNIINACKKMSRSARDQALREAKIKAYKSLANCYEALKQSDIAMTQYLNIVQMPQKDNDKAEIKAIFEECETKVNEWKESQKFSSDHSSESKDAAIENYKSSFQINHIPAYQTKIQYAHNNTADVIETKSSTNNILETKPTQTVSSKGEVRKTKKNIKERAKDSLLENKKEKKPTQSNQTIARLLDKYKNENKYKQILSALMSLISTEELNYLFDFQEKIKKQFPDIKFEIRGSFVFKLIIEFLFPGSELAKSITPGDIDSYFIFPTDAEPLTSEQYSALYKALNGLELNGRKLEWFKRTRYFINYKSVPNDESKSIPIDLTIKLPGYNQKDNLIAMTNESLEFSNSFSDNPQHINLPIGDKRFILMKPNPALMEQLREYLFALDETPDPALDNVTGYFDRLYKAYSKVANYFTINPIAETAMSAPWQLHYFTYKLQNDNELACLGELSQMFKNKNAKVGQLVEVYFLSTLLQEFHVNNELNIELIQRESFVSDEAKSETTNDISKLEYNVGLNLVDFAEKKGLLLLAFNMTNILLTYMDKIIKANKVISAESIQVHIQFVKDYLMSYYKNGISMDVAASTLLKTNRSAGLQQSSTSVLSSSRNTIFTSSEVQNTPSVRNTISITKNNN